MFGCEKFWGVCPIVSFVGDSLSFDRILYASLDVSGHCPIESVLAEFFPIETPPLSTQVLERLIYRIS